jgi:hypothetical protein
MVDTDGRTLELLVHPADVQDRGSHPAGAALLIVSWS